jgi:copper transport protein
LVLAVLGWKYSSNAQGWWKGAALSAALLTIVTFSMSGHPNSLSPRWLWVIVDELHLGAITLWLGGLIALAFAGKEWMAQPEAVRPIERFSLTATVCVPIIVATGVAQTLKLAGGLDDVTATDWGRMLLTKVMVVIALLAVAGVSRWLLRHDGAASIRRTVIAEAVLGVLVVALAAGMVGQPPRPGVPSRAYDEVVTANGVIASVSISPGQVGANEVHILITPPGGSLTPVASATARVSLPSANLPAAPVTLASEGPNHFSGAITFPESGDWTFELVVQITESDSALLKTTVPIP